MTHRTHRTRRTRGHHQAELHFRSWGGPRPGAGRKRSGPRARVSHAARPEQSPARPIHLTIRLREGLPSLRRDAPRIAITRAFRSAGDRLGLRLSQFSLQSNHIHLIAEAEDRAALSRGMQGLLVRVARAVNRLWRRRGSVFADRFHARPLENPREVRNALLYVLQNARRHGLQLAGLDPYSSGPWFDGWLEKHEVASPSPVVRARSWLLQEGWRRHGLIGLGESPKVRDP
jgi:REP element-mobilizing transposase RayT